MQLREYMRENQLTAQDVSNKMGESRRTIEKWARNERYPRPMAQQKLIDMSEGKITADGILNGFVSKKTPV